MSEDDIIPPERRDSVAAAEYVLGTLAGDERRALEQRLVNEPALATEVASWESRLGTLADDVAPVAPPPEMWSRIEAGLRAPIAAQPARARLWENVLFWRSFAFGATALAAVLAIVAVMATSPFPRGNAGPMVATLNVAGGTGGFLAAIADGRVTVMPAAFSDQGQRALELWLIPAGDHPYSLGLIQPGAPVHLTVPPNLRARLGNEATLAISLEPQGGSPTGLPTGPVIANGKLTSL